MTILKQFYEHRNHRKGKNQYMESVAPVKEHYLTLESDVCPYRSKVPSASAVTHPALKLWTD